MIAAIATFIWWNTPSQPFVNYLSLSLMIVCSVSTVIFNGEHRYQVTKVSRYASFEALLDSEDPRRIAPELPSRERRVVRLYYLEGRSYEEISTELNVPVNSIGPVLSRARKKLRQGVKGAPPVQRDIQPKTK